MVMKNRRCSIQINLALKATAVVLFILVLFTSPLAQTLSSAPFAVANYATASHGLSEQEIATLSSLKQVDDYPLYTMRFFGAYNHSAYSEILKQARTKDIGSIYSRKWPTMWSCSLFTVLGEKKGMIYGRNFDWNYSPALLLFTDPPNGHASVSMVDIAYLRLPNVDNLCNLPIGRRRALLGAPSIPFDGMNERGLTIGMAAVPGGNLRYSPGKKEISCVRVIRKILDHADTVDEALRILQSYNIDMGGLRLHYLIADSFGKAVLVEYYQDKTVVIPNEKPWHLATNFQVASILQSPIGKCRRYDRMTKRLEESHGKLLSHEAMALLKSVSKLRTQWSVVYEMSTGGVSVAMDRKYSNLHRFHINILAQ